jgi:putative membrane protein
MTGWLLAALHLLALGIGLGAVWARARALKGSLDTRGIRQVLSADAWWGAAGALWIITGLLRAFAGFGKGASYYLSNHLFLTKMGLLVILLILEVGAVMEFTRWRKAVRQSGPPDVSRASRFARISILQAMLVVLMVLAATAMARGYGST